MSKIVERFEEKYEIKDDGCWEWTAFKNPKGYGMFRYCGNVRLAHRVSFQLHKGEIPKGMYVLHSCDNPSCVNPAHLRIGDQFDNMKDKRDRGRHLRPDISKTHCSKCGLILAVTKRSNGEILKYCRPCNNKQSKEYYYRKKLTRI